LLSNIDKEGPAAGKDQQTQQKSGTAFRRHGETWFKPGHQKWEQEPN